MCAHYKYVVGSLVSIAGGWTSKEEEGAGLGDYLHERRNLVAMPRDDGMLGGDDSQPPPVKNDPVEMEDIFPGCMAEIVIVEKGVRKIVPSAYGLVPPWIPEEQTRPLCLHNARDDSLNGKYIKPSFREALFKRRCIASLRVIEENLGGNKWLEIRHATHGQDFFIASLFNYPHHLSPTITHCLITTSPNEKIAPLHDRMPVILDHKDIGAWLDPKTPLPVLFAMFKPCPVEIIGRITERQDPSRRRKRQEGFDFDE